jgi:lysophospholipase L1-like esterase
MRGYGRALALVGYIALFCVVAGEIGIRALYDSFRNYSMEVWRYAADLKQPLSDDRLPFHHVPNRCGTYYGQEISTNSLGFRGCECDACKPIGKRRIVCLGDSFTLGWGVQLEQTFPKRLERMLNETDGSFEIINMGIGNYNTTMEVELFKSKGLPLQPDMVILAYFINDTEPIPERKSSTTYWAIRHSYFFAFIFDRFVRLRSRLVTAFQWSTYYRGLYSSENSENLAMNRASFRELVRLCDDNAIGLLVVNIPELHDLSAYPFSYATDYVRDLAAESSAPFIDLLPAMSGYEPESLWVSQEDPHANATANAVIAEQIYARILEEGYFE